MKTWLIISVFILITTTNSRSDETSVKDDKSKNLPKKMLARRREEHLNILKMIAQNPKYEHRFQLILIGITKSLDLINEHKSQLKGENIEEISKAKMIVLENICLFMDFLVNFNDDIYMILNKITRSDPDKNWKEMLKFSVETLQKNEELLDAITSKEFEFLKDNLERLMNEERIPDYTFENSIRKLLELTQQSNKEDEDSLKVVKKKKKFKKGPGLQGRVEL